MSNILKKIAGIILILFTILFSFAFFHALKTTISKSSQKFETDEPGAIGYAIGTFISFIIIVVILYFLIKLILKLMKKKEKKIDVTIINEIGVEE